MTVLHTLAVALGICLALATTANLLRALVVPRAGPLLSWRAVDAAVDGAFRLITSRIVDYEKRDRVLAAQGPLFLLAQLFTWLLAYELAYLLILWPATGGLGAAAREAASSMVTLGFVATQGAGPTAVDVIAALSGLIVITLQIAYLPTLYAAFNRREAEVTLLETRAGMPPWGPELLLRTRYGIHIKTDDLPELYSRWERWAADVAESHSNYPVLVRFRSPRPLFSWLIGLLAVMDSAAILLAVAPSQERIEPRLALRVGFTALREIAGALGIPVDPDPDPDGQIKLSFEEFVQALDQLRAVGFPVERTAEEAWPHFRGWRVNYEPIAYALALRTDAVPAPWSGPRRWSHEPITVKRPPNRQPSAPGQVPV